MRRLRYGDHWKVLEGTKAVAKRFHLIAALAVLLILMFLFWIGSLLLEDYVVSRVKEANLSHHWDLYTRFMYLVTNYPVRSAIVLTCVFLVASELHIRAKSHPIWKALFGDDERQKPWRKTNLPCAMPCSCSSQPSESTASTDA